MTVFGIVLVVDGVVDELEAVAGNEVADAALAGEGFADLVFALLAEFGVALDFSGVSTVVLALGVVVFKTVGESGSRLSVLGASGVVTDMGGDGLVVVAGELGVTGLDLAGGVPLVEGVVGFDAVGAVVAQDIVADVARTTGREGVVGVKKDEVVLRDVALFLGVVGLVPAFASVGGPQGGFRVGAVAVAGADAFFGKQAFDEG